MALTRRVWPSFSVASNRELQTWNCPTVTNQINNPTSTTIKTITNPIKIFIVQQYDANNAVILASRLASQTAAALNISVESIASASIVAVDLNDGQTNLSASAVIFSFSLAQLEHADRLLEMIASGRLQLTCSPGSACKIPIDQDLQGFYERGEWPLVGVNGDLLNVLVTSFTKTSMKSRELFDASTKISTEIIEYSSKLLLPYQDWKPKIDSLKNSLTTRSLKL